MGFNSGFKGLTDAVIIPLPTKNVDLPTPRAASPRHVHRIVGSSYTSNIDSDFDVERACFKFSAFYGVNRELNQIEE